MITTMTTTVMLVFLLFLVLVVLVLQDIRAYRTGHNSPNRTEGTATKFVTNESPSSTTEESGAKTTFSISWTTRSAWLTILARLLSIAGRRSSILVLGGVWRVSTVFTIRRYLLLIIATLWWRICAVRTWRR